MVVVLVTVNISVGRTIRKGGGDERDVRKKARRKEAMKKAMKKT